MSEILAMATFALVMSITPGPVNLLTLSSAAQFGLRHSLRIVGGATAGFILMLILCALSLDWITTQFSPILSLLSVVGKLLLLYIGVGIFRAKDALGKLSSSRSIGWMSAALLQWLNPKAWMACLAGTSAFTLTQGASKLVLFSSIYGVICFVCIGLWAILGSQLHRYLTSKQRLTVFNRAMGSCLIVCAILFWLQELSEPASRF